MWFNEEMTAPAVLGRDREVEAIGEDMRPQGQSADHQWRPGTAASLVLAGLWRSLGEDGWLPGSRHWRWPAYHAGAVVVDVLRHPPLALEQALPRMTVLDGPAAVALEKII